MTRRYEPVLERRRKPLFARRQRGLRLLRMTLAVLALGAINAGIAVAAQLIS